MFNLQIPHMHCEETMTAARVKSSLTSSSKYSLRFLKWLNFDSNENRVWFHASIVFKYLLMMVAIEPCSRLTCQPLIWKKKHLPKYYCAKFFKSTTQNGPPVIIKRGSWFITFHVFNSSYFFHTCLALLVKLMMVKVLHSLVWFLFHTFCLIPSHLISINVIHIYIYNILNVEATVWKK